MWLQKYKSVLGTIMIHLIDLYTNPHNQWIYFPYSKRDLADVINSKNLRWWDYPRLSVEAQWNHKCPRKGIDGSRRARVRKRDMTMAAQTNANIGRRGHKTKTVGTL